MRRVSSLRARMVDGSGRGFRRARVLDAVQVLLVRPIVTGASLRNHHLLFLQVCRGLLGSLALRFFELKQPAEFFSPTVQRRITLTFSFVDRSHTPHQILIV